MTKTIVQRTTSLAALAVGLACGSTGLASIVYDNSSTDLNRSYAPANGIEFGDEIFLAGSDRVITDFRFETFLSGNANGNETGQLIFRLNNGASLGANRNAPGPEIYRSATFSLGTGRQTVIASGLSVPVTANSFTWSVILNGVENTEQAGLMLYDPPTVGSSFDDIWQFENNAWNTLRLDGGATPVNFAARITAVPEPSTVTLGIVGGLSLLGYLGWRRRSN